MTRRIAAVTAASSSSGRSIVGTASDIIGGHLSSKAPRPRARVDRRRQPRVPSKTCFDVFRRNCSQGETAAMTKDLEILIEAARTVQPSPDQEEEQRRSFAYGNTAFENSLITREMVDRQAEAIDRERGTRRRA